MSRKKIYLSYAENNCIPIRLDLPEKFKHLASETWNAALLDNAATNAVAEKAWCNCYVASLNGSKTRNIRHPKGTNTYRFGNGNLFTVVENVDIPIVVGCNLFTVIENVDIPIVVGSKHVTLNTEEATLYFHCQENP